ncbi:hypothetical protein DVR12_19260 [Chitinophaga silvatica]|uniref:Peptidase M48 domain-containing protein n=1 Tax=Chitinophaga silvatica TaxID=2282649 RepID=A0A3E1Y734_9BACT|nr:M48 family metalloprotease [Chitinophaga silvatica]RFS20698.1 hypothetical protein DVR12_19260 [Chitinophaga silvatica]
MENFNFYPPNPVSVDRNLVKPGSSFQKEVVKIIGSLLLFCIVYALLLLTAMAVAAGFIALGVGVLSLSLHLMMILLALSLMGVGVFIIIFLFKFVFTSLKDQKADRIEIFEEQHPNLFEFLKRLTKDTNTPMPKHVFISSGVNACVFYDSSILSLIFPVKKNLEIGLGLVNSLNLSEFKQVLAHEFGHFSQRSMKFGSYVYMMNHIIYNMLFQNQGYVRMLNFLQNIHSIFSLTTHLIIWIVKIIQSILQKMYKHLNLSHRRLSREMEFHADAISAAVTGSDAAISALRRIEFSNIRMEHCFRKVNRLAEKKVALLNVYDLQRRTAIITATQHGMELEEGLPRLIDSELPGAAKTRVQYTDLWASHPTDAEREARYVKANVINITDKRLAWVLFNNQQAVEEEMTRHYISITTETEIESVVDSTELEKELSDAYKRYASPLLFGGYFDNRSFSMIDTTKEEEQQLPAFTSFYNNQQIEKLNRHLQNKYDLHFLEAIAEKQVAVEYFKVDDQEYKINEIQPVIEQLALEVQEGDIWLQEQDQIAYQLNLSVASNAAEQLAIMASYENVLSIQEKDEQIKVLAFVIKRKVEELCSLEGWPLDELINQLMILKNSEKELKAILEQLVGQKVVPKEMDEDFEEDVLNYLKTNYTYLASSTYIVEELLSTYDIGQRTSINVEKAVILARKEYLDCISTLCQQ